MVSEVPALLIEHYKAARARIDQEIASMNSYETLIVSAWGAVYAAYFTFKMRDDVLSWGVLSVPVILSVYGLMRYNSQRTVIKRHEAYLKLIEKKTVDFNLGLPGLITFYDDDREYFSERPKGPLRMARWVLWGALIAVSSLFWCAAVAFPLWAWGLHLGR